MKHSRLCAGTVARLGAMVAVALAACGATAQAASRSHRAPRHHRLRNHRHAAVYRGTTAYGGITAHGQPLHLAAQTNQSGNWSGYNQGTLEQGGKLFNSITGAWTVPTATQHTPGQAEYSSDWIGIGGGCVDANCTVPDSTLIQTGTEQDVDSSGAASYSAWWEIVPGPSLQINTMTIHPGDRMQASVAEAVPNSNVWVITISDTSDGQSYTTTVPYTSTHATAEWIQETPLILDPSNPGLAPLPRLTSPAFDLATTNGQPANLKASEEINLVDSNNQVIGAPSAPDPDSDGFNVCAWAGTCTAPSSS